MEANLSDYDTILFRYLDGHRISLKTSFGHKKTSFMKLNSDKTVTASREPAYLLD